MAVRRESVIVDADVNPFVRGMATASAAASAFAGNLDQADSRLANLVQTGLALTPALVPIGAAAIPAIAGLSTQLGFAIGAAGVAVVAFQGVGDALKAVNEYQIEPSAENFAKLKEEMATLGPAGQEFVLFLQDLRPRMQEIQNVAQEGLFPGMQEGLSELLKLQPQLQRIVGEIASTTGDLMAEAGDNLNDPRWREFFNYIETTARPTLSDMGRTFGNFTEGLAQMLMAFDPLSRDFSQGFLDMSRSFKDWAAGLDGSQGFTDFVNYIRETGPVVKDTLGAFANAIVELVKATAPVGQVVLPMLEELANAVAALASSPAGPALIGLAAGIGAIGRSLAIVKAVGGSAAIAPLLMPFKDAGMAARGLKADAAAYLDFGSALGTWGGGADKAAGAGSRLSGAFGKLGRAGAGLAGLAAILSDLDDNFGGANTVSGVLLGTAAAGPIGAGIGALIGGITDLARANNDLEDSMKNLDLSAEDAYDFEGQDKALADAKSKLDDYQDSVGRARSPLGKSYGDMFRFVSDFWTNSSEESEKGIRDQEDALTKVKDNVRDLLTIASGQGKYQSMPFADMADQITIVQAALQRANLDIKDFNPGDATNWVKYSDAIKDYVRSTDSVSGRSKAVASALADMEDDMIQTATAAETLKAAMDALFGVQLNQSEATDAWIRGLKTLKGELKGVTDLVRGQSTAALDDRAAIRDRVELLQQKVAADAEAGASGQRLAQTLIDGRNAIIDQAKAAGLAGPQVREYLNTLGLTPKSLTTIITASGVLSAKQQVGALAKLYDLTPRQVTTLVKAAGAEPTEAKIKSLAREYKLTPKQVTTLLKAVDKASKPINDAQKRSDQLGNSKPTPTLSALDRASGIISGVQRKVRDTDKMSADPTITARDHATGVLGAIQRAINSITSKTVTITTVYNAVRTTHGKGAPDVSADGNLYEFADGGYLPRIGDQQPQVRGYTGPRGLTWSEEGSGPWEAFISGHPAKIDRSRAIATEVVNRLGGTAMFAGGGFTAPTVNLPAPNFAVSTLSDRDVARIAAAVQAGSAAGTAAGMSGRDKAALAGRRT